MTLKEAYDKLEKTKENESYFNIWEVAETEFGIYGVCFEEDAEKCERLKIYYLHKWYCTDTWVGYRAYFLDGELITISKQIGRKWDQEFYYVCEDSKKKFEEYIKSFVTDSEDYNINLLNDEDWCTVIDKN